MRHLQRARRASLSNIYQKRPPSLPLSDSYAIRRPLLFPNFLPAHLHEESVVDLVSTAIAHGRLVEWGTITAGAA